MVNYNRFLARPSLWLPGVAAAFAVFACSKLNLENTLPSSVGSVILRGMTFMTSGLAVSVAWDAARLHEVARIMGRRSQLLKLVGWTLIPCWAWILVAFLLLWGYQIIAMDAVIYPHPLTLLLAVIMGTTWSILGIVFVWVLPRIVGLLMAIIMPFMVTSFAWTLPDFMWRHMFGVPSFCCGLSSTLNTNMVLASTLCLTSMSTVGVALILFVRGIPAMQVTRVISGAIMVIGVGGFGGSAMIAQSLENFAATQPRDIRESVCRNGMCFWPEHTEEQIAANSAAYDQIRATMPAQWLPPTSPTTPAISPDLNFKIGVINESSWMLGEPNSPLPFTDSVDKNEIYGHFANILVSRQLGFLIPLIDADNWQKWASHQSKPASPEEVYSWVESELKQRGLSDIKPQ